MSENTVRWVVSFTLKIYSIFIFISAWMNWGLLSGVYKAIFFFSFSIFLFHKIGWWWFIIVVKYVYCKYALSVCVVLKSDGGAIVVGWLSGNESAFFSNQVTNFYTTNITRVIYEYHVPNTLPNNISYIIHNSTYRTHKYV